MSAAPVLDLEAYRRKRTAGPAAHAVTSRWVPVWVWFYVWPTP